MVFGVILLLLCVPLLQMKFNLIKVKPLYGDIVNIEKQKLTQSNWLNESYQKNFEQYLNQHFGFRNYFVRLNNQLAYSISEKAKANGVIIGNNDYLYEENYIKAYLGTDYIGKNEIQKRVFKLKKIQDTLKAMNKDLIVILAPGKGSYFPEYIPNYLLKQKTPVSNYTTYTDEFKKTNIHYLDFKKWFMQMKPITPYPLYAQAGIHWSKYGEFLAADSLVRYIGNLRHINIPKLILDTIIVKTINEQEDYDIGDGMNLLFYMPTYPMAYPQFHIQKNKTTIKPNVLVVADSYYWGMYNSGLSKNVFNKGQFWYYNERIYPEKNNESMFVSEINLKKEVEKNDVIILLSTDANLYKFPFGFIDQLYYKYYIDKQ